MKVKLLDSLPMASLTQGKIYTVLSEEGNYYKISNDMGVTDGWFKNRFVVVEEEPKPVIFKLDSLYYRPEFIEYHYKCCGFTSIGLPLFENPAGHPVAVGENRSKLVEYVKPIEVGSRVRFGQSELLVTAIHGDYAWVHTENGGNYHGGPGGMIQRLDKLKVI